MMGTVFIPLLSPAARSGVKVTMPIQEPVNPVVVVCPCATRRIPALDKSKTASIGNNSFRVMSFNLLFSIYLHFVQSIQPRRSECLSRPEGRLRISVDRIVPENGALAIFLESPAADEQTIL